MRIFTKIVDRVSEIAGHPLTVGLAFLLIGLWFGFGPMFHFSETYQMLINTGTTIVTFLLGFIILASGNKGDRAVHVKLDAILKGMADLDDRFIGIEKLTPQEIRSLEQELKPAAV